MQGFTLLLLHHLSSCKGNTKFTSFDDMPQNSLLYDSRTLLYCRRALNVLISFFCVQLYALPEIVDSEMSIKTGECGLVSLEKKLS